MSQFIGFDEPKINENFFELFKDGKPYLFLYHECRVREVIYPEYGNFTVYLEKVFDSGYGPEVGSRLVFSLENAIIESLHASADGNFEDLDEVICTSNDNEKLKIKIVLSGIDFNINCDRITLRKHEN